jgi:LCP family protein required for cell wall assembly
MQLSMRGMPMRAIRLLLKTTAIALLALTLSTNRFLPINYLIIIGVVEIGLLLLVWKRKVIQIFIVLLMMITSMGLMYAENIASRLIKYNPDQINTASFFTLKESKILTVKSLVKGTISISSIVEDTNREYIQKKLESNGFKSTMKSFQGIYDGIQSLYDGQIDTIVFEQAYLSTVLEIDPDFINKTKVVWSVNNTTVNNNDSSAVKVTKEPFIVYLSGIDIEGPISTVSRSDVNILMAINPVTNKIQTISIPRDAYVGLGCKRNLPLDKLTHAGIYGVGCSIKTIENLMGIKINYYARVNFTSLMKIVNALDYINVNSNYDFSKGGVTIHKGVNKLNGYGALVFARVRYEIPGGDVTRSLHQQEVIRAILARLQEPLMLTKIESIIGAVQGNVDTNIKGSELLSLLRKQLQSNKPWTISAYSIAGKNELRPTYSMGAMLLYVVQLYNEKIEEAKKLIDTVMNPPKEAATK